MADTDGFGIEAWDIPFEDLEFGTLVGKGNFGCVWSGEYIGTPVAIKKVEQQGVEDLPPEYILDKETALKYFQRELTVLKSIHHPNVVQFMGTSVHEDSVYIVTEWVGGGDLRKLIKKKQIPVTWKERAEIARDTAIAMAYLHVKNLIHRDLKPANLLLTEHGRVKVCDLGLARTIEASEKGEGKKYYTIAGTDMWMAPEVILGESYDFKCDVFSFGCILYNLIKRHAPPRRKPANGYKFEEDVMMADIPPRCPKVMIDLMKECLAHEPEDRPTFREVAPKLKALVPELPEQDEGEEEQKTIEIDGVQVEIESILKTSREQGSKIEQGSKVASPVLPAALPPWPEDGSTVKKGPTASFLNAAATPPPPPSTTTTTAPPVEGSRAKAASPQPVSHNEGEKQEQKEEQGKEKESHTEEEEEPDKEIKYGEEELRNTRFAVLFKAIREKEKAKNSKNATQADAGSSVVAGNAPGTPKHNEVMRNKRFAALYSKLNESN